MAIFSELQADVKRGAVRDKSGTEFDTAVKRAINRAVNRLSRECRWRPLRRESSISTVTSYTEGTGAVSVTEDSTAVTVTLAPAPILLGAVTADVRGMALAATWPPRSIAPFKRAI